MFWFISQLLEAIDDEQKQLLVKECSALFSTHPRTALPILVQLGIMDAIKCMKRHYSG